MLDFRGMQVKELSAKTGISKNTLDNYLSGQKSLPNIENGVKIARILGVTVEYLVTRASAISDSELPEISQTQNISYQKLSQNPDISDLLHDLKHLRKSDFESIRNIVKSLAQR